MTAKARWVVPLNFRAEDKPVLDSALEVAKIEGTTLTSVLRSALKEYTEKKIKKKQEAGLCKIDDFILSKEMISPNIPSSFSEILTPKHLGMFGDSDVLRLARQVCGRKQELEAELKRGFMFRWT